MGNIAKFFGAGKLQFKIMAISERPGHNFVTIACAIYPKLGYKDLWLIALLNCQLPPLPASLTPACLTHPCLTPSPLPHPLIPACIPHLHPCLTFPPMPPFSILRNMLHPRNIYCTSFPEVLAYHYHLQGNS